MISWIQSKEFVDVVSALPDEDMPSFFGLPANIERSSQRIESTKVHFPDFFSAMDSINNQ